jgi:hypothetical protein
MKHPLDDDGSIPTSYLNGFKTYKNLSELSPIATYGLDSEVDVYMSGIPPSIRSDIAQKSKLSQNNRFGFSNSTEMIQFDEFEDILGSDIDTNYQYGDIFMTQDGFSAVFVDDDKIDIIEDLSQSSVAFRYNSETKGSIITNAPTTSHTEIFNQFEWDIQQTNGQSVDVPACQGLSDSFSCNFADLVEKLTFPRTLAEVPDDYWVNFNHYSEKYQQWVKALFQAVTGQDPIDPSQHAIDCQTCQGLDCFECGFWASRFVWATGKYEFYWETDLSKKPPAVVCEPGLVLPVCHEVTPDYYQPNTTTHPPVKDSGVIVALHFNGMMSKVKDLLSNFFSFTKDLTIMTTNTKILGTSVVGFDLKIDHFNIFRMEFQPYGGHLVLKLVTDFKATAQLRTIIGNTRLVFEVKSYTIDISMKPEIINGRLVFHSVQTHAYWNRINVDARGGWFGQTLLNLATNGMKKLRAPIVELLGTTIPTQLNPLMASIFESFKSPPPEEMRLSFSNWPVPAYLDLQFSRPVNIDQTTQSIMFYLSGKVLRAHDNKRFISAPAPHTIGFTPRGSSFLQVEISDTVFNDLLQAWYTSHKPELALSYHTVVDFEQVNGLKDFINLLKVFMPNLQTSHDIVTTISMAYAPVVAFGEDKLKVTAIYQIKCTLGQTNLATFLVTLEGNLSITRTGYPFRIIPRMDQFTVTFYVYDTHYRPQVMPDFGNSVNFITNYAVIPLINLSMSDGVEIQDTGDMVYIKGVNFVPGGIWVVMDIRG